METLEIRPAEAIGPAFEAPKGHAKGLYFAPDPLVFTHRIQISTLALDARLACARLQPAVERSGRHRRSLRRAAGTAARGSRRIGGGGDLRPPARGRERR